MNEAYIVFGHHRTGTSLTMGILRALGVWIGDDYKMEGPKNPCYFEDNGLIDFIINRKGTPEAIVNRLSQKQKWGMKLPQLVHYWDRFKDLIPDPRFVITHRDMDACITSIMRTSGKPRSQVISEIENTYRLIEEITLGHRRIYIKFERWFPPEKQLKELSDFVGLAVTHKALRLPRLRYKHF